VQRSAVLFLQKLLKVNLTKSPQIETSSGSPAAMDSNNWRVKRDPADAPEKHRTPMRSYQQRRPGQEGIPGSQQGGGRFSSPISSSRDGFRKPLDDEKAERAIEEGRRLYVGNLPYEATVKDVEELFKDIGDGVGTYPRNNLNF
jgi:hypothetical protein